MATITDTNFEDLAKILNGIAKDTTLSQLAPALGVALEKGLGKAGGELDQKIGKADSALQSGVRKSLDVLGGGAKIVGGTMLDAGAKLAAGNARLSDGFTVLKDNLGGNANLLTKSFDLIGGGAVNVATYLEDSVDSFQMLSKIGAGAAGNLQTLREQAAQARISFDDFNKIIANNTESLAGFAGGVVEGRNQFTQLTRDLFTLQDGANADSLYNLGYSFEEMNEQLADTIALTRRRDLQTEQSRREAIASAVALAKQQDLMAKLTGKDIKQIQDETRSRLQEGSTQAKVRLLERQGIEGVAESMSAATNTLSSAPKVVRDLVQQVFELGVPLDDSTKAYAALNGQTYGLVEQLAAIQGDDTLSAEERRKKSTEVAEKIAASAAQEADSVSNLTVSTLGRISDVGGVMADSLEEIGPLIDNLRNHTDRLGEEIGESVTYFDALNDVLFNLKANQDQQVTDGNALLNTVRETETVLRNAGSALNQELAQVFDNNVVRNFLNSMGDALSEFSAEDIENIANTIAETVAPSDSISNVIEAILASQENLTQAQKDQLNSLLAQAKAAETTLQTPGISGTERSNASNTLTEIENAVKVIITDLDPAAQTAFKDALVGGNVSDGTISAKVLERAIDSGDVKDTPEARALVEQLKELKGAANDVSELGKEVGGEINDALGGSEDTLFGSIKKGVADILGFKSGTLGVTGDLFNDFGSGTLAMLHGNEAVVTPEQLNNIIGMSLAGMQAMAQKTGASPLNNNLDSNLQSLTEMISGINGQTQSATLQTPSNSANQDLIRKLEELNTTMQQVVMHVAQSNNYGKEQLRVSRSMTGNLFAGVG